VQEPCQTWQSMWQGIGSVQFKGIWDVGDIYKHSCWIRVTVENVLVRVRLFGNTTQMRAAHDFIFFHFLGIRGRT